MATTATIDPELKTALDALRAGIAGAAPASKLQELQTQVDAIDRKMTERVMAGPAEPTLVKSFEENESVRRLLHDKKGRAMIHLKGRDVAQLMQMKSIITGVTSGNVNGDPLAPVGSQATGVLPIQRIPGIVPEARQTLKVRDLFAQRPTSFQLVDFVRVNTPLSIASPVAEASVKPENQLTFTAYSERVKLLATFILATRQVLDDFDELATFLQTSLPFYVNLEEELQLLAGDGTGENLHGVNPQAATFNAALLPSAAKGWNKIDVLAAAIEQIQIAKEIDPTFIVLSVKDWWDIRLTKDGFGRYILGDPQSQVRPSLFGLDVVPTTSEPTGNFLVGSGSPIAAEIRDRMEMAVEISTEDSDNFRRNLVTIRAEKRLAMVVKRPGSFCQGTFTTSP